MSDEQKYVIGDPMQKIPSHVVISASEATELYFYMRHQYLSPNSYPHLSALISRLAAVSESPIVDVNGTVMQD